MDERAYQRSLDERVAKLEVIIARLSEQVDELTAKLADVASAEQIIRRAAAR